MGALITRPERAAFLGLAWEEQKGGKFLALFAKGPAAYLKATCIAPGHLDDQQSMCIYPNGVWCYGCGQRWWPDQFVESLGDRELIVERQRRAEHGKAEYIPFSEVETFHRWLCARDGWRSDRLAEMYARGLRLDTLEANLIGHTGDAFVIPVLGPDRKVLSLRYRRDDGLDTDRPKYWGTPGMNGVQFYYPQIPFTVEPRQQDTLFLCEGELDALRLAQEGLYALSLTNGCNAITPDHAAVLAKLAPRIVVAYDQDEPGRKAAAVADGLLNACGATARRLLWPVTCGKDVTEFLQRWPVPKFLKYAENIWL